MFVSPHKETLTPQQPLAPTDLLSTYTDSPVLDTSTNGHTAPEVLRIRLLPRSRPASRRGPARAQCSSFPLRACPCHLSAHRLVDVRAPPSGYCESHCHDPLCAVFVWTCVSTLLGRYLGVELMGRMAFLEPAG